MRKLRPRPSIPLPDLYWINPEQLRVALGRSSYVWRSVDLPGLLEYFPPTALGPDLPSDYRWPIDSIAQQMPHLVSHLGPGTWFDRYKQRKRSEAAAYVAKREAEHSIKRSAVAA